MPQKHLTYLPRPLTLTVLTHLPPLQDSLEGRNQQHRWSMINMEAGAVIIHVSEISNQGSHPEGRELGLEARPPALL